MEPEGGIILVDKPRGWTSFQVVKHFKKQRNLKKVGHAGTLDPLASGLLILCYGKWTKKISHFQNLKKVYTGTITLGKTTPSYDAETDFDSIIENFYVSESEIINARDKLIGEIIQTPPIYSAIKHKGRRLYKIARSDIHNDIVEIKKRKVNILKFNIESIELPDLHFYIECSKGTYIRSIAHDLGKFLKVGGYLSNLRRIKIGDYNVKDAHPIL